MVFPPTLSLHALEAFPVGTLPRRCHQPSRNSRKDSGSTLLQPATLDLSLELLPAGWGILLDAVFAQQAGRPAAIEDDARARQVQWKAAPGISQQPILWRQKLGPNGNDVNVVRVRPQKNLWVFLVHCQIPSWACRSSVRDWFMNLWRLVRAPFGLPQVQTLCNLFDREGRLLPQTSGQRQLEAITLRTSRQVLFRPV
jgi:hypothetical protein